MLRSILAAILSLPHRLFIYISSTLTKKTQDVSVTNPAESSEEDHPLLKQNSQIRSYATSHATYPAIRTFYHPHAHADKLKAIADLPLLVFVHGLGGSLPQFAPLLGSLLSIGPCFGIDLPGHGLSEFSPREPQAYAMEALVELWKVAIDQICEEQGHDSVVLVCHSLGCSIGALLTSETSPVANLSQRVVGMVSICPKSSPPNRSQVRTARLLLRLPDFVFDLLRWLDKRGGTESRSVSRFVGTGAGEDQKRLQLRFNEQFPTPVWKRTVVGCIPIYDKQGLAHGGMPGQSVWRGVQVPLFLIVGEADTVTKPQEATEIMSFLKHDLDSKPSPSLDSIASESQPVPIASEVDTSPDPDPSNKPGGADDKKFGVLPNVTELKSRHSAIVKSVILPSPAAHALMYDHSTYRTVAGLIEDFLGQHVSHQLGLGWQLQQLTTSGKWDVKNLEKWKRVLPVSGPIDGGLFRALKTLREQDEEHTPAVFVRTWRDRIFAVVDISHDSPVYDTKVLEAGGIEYHKFPTVSKVPPTLIEVKDFNALVDRLRKENDDRQTNDRPKAAIGVHCHYGYNRTGFFIVCYLVEKRGYTVQDAIDEFARRKPPGIRHDHFIDTLFVRYCVGLRRGSTVK